MIMANAANTSSRPCPASPNIREKRKGNDTMAYGAEIQQQQHQQPTSEQYIVSTMARHITRTLQCLNPAS